MFIILCLLRALPLWMRAYLAEGERDVFLVLAHGEDEARHQLAGIASIGRHHKRHIEGRDLGSLQSWATFLDTCSVVHSHESGCRQEKGLQGQMLYMFGWLLL